jgi:hypothetical protein
MPNLVDRRSFIGGSDARIMGTFETLGVLPQLPGALWNAPVWTRNSGGVLRRDKLPPFPRELSRNRTSYFLRPDANPFLRRTPGPPPFSAMNSMPANSSASRIFCRVSVRPPRGPSCASSRLIVGLDTSAAVASSSWDQPSSALAAFNWRIDTFSISINSH